VLIVYKQTRATAAGAITMSPLYNFALNMDETVRVVRIARPTLDKLLRETRSFTERRAGRRGESAFLLSDLMTLNAWRCLNENGVAYSTAERLVPETLGIFGLLRNGRATARRVLENVDGHLVSRDARNPEHAPVVIELHLWNVFDDLYPRFRDAVRAKARAVDNIDEALHEFATSMEASRSY
jgi:hypothetical protein